MEVEAAAAWVMEVEASAAWVMPRRKTKQKQTLQYDHCCYLLSLKNKSLHARMPFALLSLSGVALG